MRGIEDCLLEPIFVCGSMVFVGPGDDTCQWNVRAALISPLTPPSLADHGVVTHNYETVSVLEK